MSLQTFYIHLLVTAPERGYLHVVVAKVSFTVVVDAFKIFTLRLAAPFDKGLHTAYISLNKALILVPVLFSVRSIVV